MSSTEPSPDVTAASKTDQTLYLYVTTAVYGAFFVVLPFFVKKGPNQGITRCCIMLSIFSLWIFWAIVYTAQMRPLLGPRMHNTSLAWIKYAWMGENGKNASI